MCSHHGGSAASAVELEQFETQRFELGHRPGYEMEVRLMPTLSPRDGLPMAVAGR